MFVGDVGGNFYALDAATGDKLWGQKIGGGIGGGVIAYRADGARKDRSHDRPHRRRLAHRSGDRKNRGAGARRRPCESPESAAVGARLQLRFVDDAALNASSPLELPV